MKKTGLLLIVVFFITLVVSAGNIKLKPNGRNYISIIENSYQELRVAMELNEIAARVVKTERGNFTELAVEGYNFSAITGIPKLPVKSLLIEIPLEADIKINIKKAVATEYSLEEFGMEYPVIPLQPPVSKSSKEIPPIVIEKDFYQKNQYKPSEMATVEVLGIFRGVRIARLNLCPVQYNPVTHKIKVFESLDVQLAFEHPDLLATLQSKEKNNNPYFEGVNRLLFNYKKINNTSKDTLSQYPIKYVIVSPPSFEPILQPFIDWKRMKGFTVIEAYTDNPSVGTTTTSIKSYLQGLYDAGTADDPSPSFILLVGDIDQIPSFNGTSGGHKSDLYYADYTGDMFPEVFIGRFSAENESQLVPQINKSLEYEKYLMPDPSFLDEVVMIAGVDAGYAPIHANGQINYGTDNYFNAAHGLISHTYLYPQSGQSATQIRQDVSNGVGYANYTAHGSSGGWADPSFSVSDVDELHNAHKYPLMVGNCCLTSKFDDDVCFGEALLRANNKGALAYIGGTNVTYWDEDFYWGVGARDIVVNPVWSASEQPGAYDAMFHDHGEQFSEWYVTNGAMITAGNMAVTIGSPNSAAYYWEIYMLMGDPSLMTYFSVPPPMSVTYDNLMPLGVTTFTVNSEPYTYVALSKEGVLHGAALADSNGLAVVPIIPFTVPGYLHIVVTGQNWQPYLDSIIVASPTGPYVLMNNKQLVENGGNNNGQVDYGENAGINISLKNWGQATANDVVMTLSTLDTFVNITDATQNFGDILPGSFSNQNNAFTLSVGGNIPDQHVVPFQAVVTDNAQNSWNNSFSLKFNAPDFSVGQIHVIDIQGNGNGKLDAGETVTLNIGALNNGHSYAPSPVGTLSTVSNLLTLNTTTSALDTLFASSEVTASFNATVSPLAQAGDIIAVDFNFSDGDYQASKTFYLSVGVIMEDWETNTLTHFSWMTAGTAPWFVTSENPYEGNYCLRSGNIYNNQHSDLLIQGTVLMEDSLSFFRKVSSELDYDYLQFYIDATKISQWSGEMLWERVAFLVSPGSHIFKWVYKKDGSQIGGLDAGWVDKIVFPPISGLTTGISDNLTKGFDYQLFPNPTSGISQLVINLEKPGRTDIVLFNTLGQEIKNIAKNQWLNEGSHTFIFDTKDLVKGVYYCRLMQENQPTVVKIVVQ